MHHIDLPAGSAIRLTVSARPNLAPHRWALRLFAKGDTLANAPARLNYGSRIGGLDCEQRIDIPTQDRDCGIEVTCAHATAAGWQDQQGAVDDDTPALLTLGFSDPSASGSRTDDVVLSFAFSGAARSETPQ